MRPKNLYVREEVMSAPKQVATSLLTKTPEPIITTQPEPITYDSSIDDASKTITNESGNKKIVLFSVIGFAVLAIAVTGYFAFRK